MRLRPEPDRHRKVSICVSHVYIQEHRIETEISISATFSFALLPLFDRGKGNAGRVEKEGGRGRLLPALLLPSVFRREKLENRR